ncbi:DUF3857 and transglutaminase domain-containing protein [Psychroserpens sp.]|uniref:DUF3857 and transglutaminase domain-containing protein n=1 Tax=Psychroserpens sp. TaxID=2020870 RepID=UPI002B267ECA|nr:DUF3857 and transglutaminase domain-containing protein [Psychroserpens sp.]
MKTIIVCLMLGITLSFQAQNFKYGKVSEEELKETINPNDTSANATVLYKKHDVRFEYRESDGFVQIVEVHERIKIYNNEGFNWATKKIRLYNRSASNSEDLQELKGYTYNLVDGDVEKEKLKKDGIFEEIANKYWKYKSFTMPNVKAGSVIEYVYEIMSPYTQIDDIYFQYSIPIKTYELRVSTPEYLVYNNLLNPRAAYVPNLVNSKANKSITFTSKQSNGTGAGASTFSSSKSNYLDNVISCNATNVPALKDEPLVDNLDNYASKLIMELSMTTFPNTPYKTYSTSWEQITKNIYDDPDFGDQLSKTNYFDEDVDALISGVTNPIEKAALIFDFVKSKVKWNEFYGFTSESGVKKAYNDGSGNSADINLMLISMLRYAGINANPVLISTKNNGIPLFPTRQGFNYVICIIQGDGFSALLDATESYSTFNTLPLRTLNWQGRLILDNGRSTWIELQPNVVSSDVTYLNAKINPDFSIEGKIRNQKTDYVAKQFRNRFADANPEEYIKYVERNNGELVVSELEIENARNVSQPINLTYNYSTTNEIEEVGDNLYFTPMLFLASEENPFKAEKRSYPIDLSYPFNDKYVINIMLPEGYEVESIPQSKKIQFNEGQGEFTYLVNENGRFLQLTINFEMKTSLVLSNDYEIFKNFYTSIIETQAEKIMLKKI